MIIKMSKENRTTFDNVIRVVSLIFLMRLTIN